MEIKPLMTFLEIQKIGGFEALTKAGYSYYELYHKIDGEYEGHGLYEVFIK